MNLPVPMNQRELDRVFRQPLPMYFTSQEVDGILSASVHDVRAHVVLNTLWKTGVRCSEMLSLKNSSLDPYNKTLRVTTLKSGTRKDVYAGVGRKPKGEGGNRLSERIIPLPDDLVANLMSWIHSRGDLGKDDLIFDFSRYTAFRIVKEACRRARIEDKRAHPHTLRHSYAVHLLRQGVPVTILKDFLGHSNVSSTLIYLRITQADARAIFNQVKW